MRYKLLGSTGEKVSSLTIGTWELGGDRYGPVVDAETRKGVYTMIDNGVNIVDTAPIYAHGKSEEKVGEFLKGGWRQKVLLCTKFGIKESEKMDGSTVNCGGYDTVIEECNESLRRLQTDYIDVYFMHWPDPNVPMEETMSAVSRLKADGKIRYVGVSNFSKEQIIEAQKTVEINVLQPPFSMINRSAMELMKWCETQGIGTATYGSLGAGVLTGTIRTKPDWPEDDMRYSFYDHFREPKFSKIQQLLTVMDKISEKTGKPLAQIAINWSTQKSFVTTALCGIRNADEANENCAAFEWSLDDEDIAILDAELDRLQIS